MEIWGGVECTVARIRNRVHDQLKLNGHEKRQGDLELIAGLGIKKIRYPLLWEKSVKNPREFFYFHDQRLSKLKELNITPILGLLHHGSGPFFTNLSDKDFPFYLAEFAMRVADRYPWITYYNPVNEPLTTARFSGLYGVWYPHQRSDEAFVKIFINEMRGVVLSMQNVKQVNTNATLVQTEDLCKIHHTQILGDQANFENTRRWLTYDLLSGKFTPEHPLYGYFLKHGIKESELTFFRENIPEPFICGFNYYPTSERYLDEHLYRYPRRYHGGNGILRYADLEAVRAGNITPAGSYNLLKEAWERYHLPLALTEVHLGCTREEQLRWFYEAYQNGLRLVSEKVDFRAITAWSLLGSFDWNSLLRLQKSHYESGVFDIRSGNPRPTALSEMIKELNTIGEFKHPILEVPGWWNREIRVLYNYQEYKSGEQDLELTKISPLLIIGARGSLGKAFARVCEKRGIVYQLVSREQVDIASRESLGKYLEKTQPWAILNAAGFTNIDKAELSTAECFRENTLGPTILAEICKSSGIKLVTFSSDQVFNGKKRNPYVENDTPSPLNKYGESKQQAEEAVLRVNPDSLIIRSSFFFNPWNPADFISLLLQQGTNCPSLYMASDIIISPTYIPDLVQTSLDLLIDNESGIWHLSGPDEISHFNFTQLALNIAGKTHNHLISCPFKKLNYTANRPTYSVLLSSQGISLPSLKTSLFNFMNELKVQPITSIYQTN